MQPFRVQAGCEEGCESQLSARTNPLPRKSTTQITMATLTSGAVDVSTCVAVERGPNAFQEPNDVPLAYAPAATAARPRRAVDYLLVGKSVIENRHLARFAAAPYLQRLLDTPEFTIMLNRTSKQLRKELIEAYAVVEVLEGVLSQTAEPFPAAIVDLCSGKGFLSTILALEYPTSQVLMVDNNQRVKTHHVETLDNVRFLRADIMRDAFEADLAAALGEATAARASGSSGHALAGSIGASTCVAVGMHLCGLLSPRAVALFEACRLLEVLVLVPCCLDKRSDSLLKAQAKLRGVEPYEAKVDELRDLLEASQGSHVAVVRDGSMRTAGGGEATEGGASCKNALLCARKHRGVQSIGTSAALQPSPPLPTPPLNTLEGGQHSGLPAQLRQMALHDASQVPPPPIPPGPSPSQMSSAERRRLRRAACRLEQQQHAAAGSPGSMPT